MQLEDSQNNVKKEGNEVKQSSGNSVFDIVIVGGGLSGLLTATSLMNHPATAPLRVAIVDANEVAAEPQSSKSAFDDRVIALAHGSVEYIKSLDAWQYMSQDAAAIETIHISDRGNYGKARVKAIDHNVDALGHVVPLASIANGLLSKLNQLPSISWFTPRTIDAMTFQPEHVEIELDGKETITAKLAIACDGGQSVCRKAANISAKVSTYQQVAVIANVGVEKHHQHRAFERFTESGPIAMLPMQGKQCSLVWTLTPEQANEVSELDDNGFCQALTKAFGTWLGAVTSASKRSVFPLSLVQAEQQTYHRLALVGNASHTIHPIAGQGFNLGVRDVVALAKLLQQAGRNSVDVGAAKVLNQYQIQRADDQQQVITLTDSMVHLFSNDYASLVAGRNIGLKVMNYLTPLQQRFVNKTMGY